MKTVEKIRVYGKSFFSFPYKIYYTENGTEQTNFVISVPKKIFKRAVKRNLIRRRIREAIRLDAVLMESVKGKDILLVYVSGEILDYGKVKESLHDALVKISC